MSSRDEMIAEIRQLNLDIAFAKRNGDKGERDCLILKKAELLKKLAIYDNEFRQKKNCGNHKNCVEGK